MRSVLPLLGTALAASLLWTACGDDPSAGPCEADPCFEGVTCTEQGDVYVCGDCPSGYEGDGETCSDADGCADSPCFAGVSCTDVAAPGSGHTCDACPAGYEGDGETCADIDGCQGTPCSDGVACMDIAAPGTGFACGDCPTGYVGDGSTCMDIDGCESAPCFAGVACTDVAAPGTGYTCDACPAGYEGDGETCIDANGCDGDPCFAGVACTDVPAPGTGYTCDACPAGYEGDGEACADVDGCLTNTSTVTCFPGVACLDVPAPGTGFSCDACPIGYDGDGFTCADTDGCAGAPCVAGTLCTDVPAPGTGFTCEQCQGVNCPILRAQAGPDQTIVDGTTTTLNGGATGFNGSFSCEWANDQDATTWTTCTTTVTPAADTVYTLTVTDASGLTAQDSVSIFLAGLTADAGPSQNIESTATATLSASWQGASCSDASCISCAWALTDTTTVASTCTTTVSPSATTEYVLTIVDSGTGNTATDSTTVFVTDQPAQLCGWNVVVMRSSSYPTGGEPNYLCDATGTARRQTVNGKPAIVLSDLNVTNVRITGTISVETGGDDDLIGFVWGWQDPRNYYLLNWKQFNQGIGSCGTGLAGIAVKKVDGSTTAPGTISFNAAAGFNYTDYTYHCSMFWSGARANESLLGDNSIFLLSPSDPGAFTGGWQDFITYRVDFYYTPTQTKVVVWSDDVPGNPPIFVTDFVIVDSSYPEGAFAFFSNSQAQVEFGDFILASLSDYEALAGADQLIQSGATALLSGSAELAVPPYLCEWSQGSVLLGSTCDLTVTPSVDTTYELMVTDAFGRVSTDTMTVFVAP